MAAPRMPLPDLCRFLEDHLLKDVVPFWMKHAMDPRGGINTCIGDDGTIQSRDKMMWSQLRAIYTFSALYNRIEKRQEWLDAAANIYRFCRDHGRDDEGRWAFKLDPEGRIVEGATSIYSDGFALLGFVEYARATGDAEPRRLALEAFANVRARLAKPGSYGTAPLPIPPGMKAHGIGMIFSFAFHGLARLTGDAEIAAAALEQADQVMNHFRRPEKRALLEFVKLDGTPEDSPEGRAVNPGHAIESMWFQIHQFRDLGGAQARRVNDCVECIRWHVEKGWDPQYGGIMLSFDAEGKEPIFWKFPDTKLWWPHTEALYALLLAHRITGEPWCLDWYWKVHDVSFRHYPVPVHGEWTQRLDRQFKKFDAVVALPVKDPFHLPRALMMCIELLRA